ncbi:hypothetical protein PPSIR1_09191 [Plesiocystis pacifica SIR-1]|uniref:Uncharacterized protein n=1 Tax=Plesiocystis pacifica SIR-1 TaxID=391625 RepID=A6G767_9BACT|nr:hypothetical protein [Plesiocystis pacifica]EDM78343.1 hypothetical protein PPSIR1_09191 [Plesiocystis pacifica SIR-1]
MSADETTQPGPADLHGRILERLRGEPEALEQLVGLGLEHVLDRPLEQLVDAEWLARALTEGVRNSARSNEFERWVAERVEEALTRADRLEGALGERVPVTLLGPVEKALGRPYQPDRELVRSLLDHPSTRTILRELLEANILEFGKRMRSMVPDAATKVPKLSGGGFASRLAGVAKGVATAVGSELEKQLEPRVNAFVDDILGVAVDQMVDRVASPEFAEDFATWRVDVLRSLLGQPVDRLVAERHKYPPGDFAADVAAILRALAAWRGLGEQVEASLTELIREYGSTSARDFLAGSGLEEAWRPALQEALVDGARDFVETPAFEAWLGVLLEE